LPAYRIFEADHEEVVCVDTLGRLTVRWPNVRRPGSSQATADEVV